MTIPQIRIIDGDTVLDRDMNTGELAAYTAMQDEAKSRADALAAKATVREALLTRLGITAEEAQLLLGGS
jgi:hypothetical protein